MQPRWTHAPAEIRLVRHGASVGNEADERAHREQAEELDLDDRDADVALSGTGRSQARALHDWLRGLEEEQRPTLVVSSPYRRAADTAREAIAGLDVPLQLDERLRERGLGILDGLTRRGIRARHPDEAARRRELGKFYYAPPSGESWSDVVLRVRSLLQDLAHGYDGERVWLFTHQAVVMSFRYVLEGMTEQQILDIDREVQIPNASVTTYRRAGAAFELERFADTTAVDRAATAVTQEGDRPGGGARGQD